MKKQYPLVVCVETGEVFEGLPEMTDTAYMRANYTYVFETPEGEHEYVTPCGGKGKLVAAYWRGDWGNTTRARALAGEVEANAMHKVP